MMSELIWSICEPCPYCGGKTRWVSYLLRENVEVGQYKCLDEECLATGPLTESTIEGGSEEKVNVDE